MLERMSCLIRNLLVTGLLLLGVCARAQPNSPGRLFIPFLDQESQSNVIVTVCDFGGMSCPRELTNTLTNPRLFSPAEQGLILNLFVKYKTVTTNAGPMGTVLAAFDRTNNIIVTPQRTVNDERFEARFQYTNSAADEELTFGKGGLYAKFRNGPQSRDGYDASFTPTSKGAYFTFAEIKHDRIDGVLARFFDDHIQGAAWSYQMATFAENDLTEYVQYTNGLVCGKDLMWDPRDGTLILEAEFPQPYDYKRHRTDLPKVQVR